VSGSPQNQDAPVSEHPGSSAVGSQAGKCRAACVALVARILRCVCERRARRVERNSRPRRQETRSRTQSRAALTADRPQQAPSFAGKAGQTHETCPCHDAVQAATRRDRRAVGDEQVVWVAHGGTCFVVTAALAPSAGDASETVPSRRWPVGGLCGSACELLVARTGFLASDRRGRGPAGVAAVLGRGVCVLLRMWFSGRSVRLGAVFEIPVCWPAMRRSR
jgi:hypothetical protein